jgi:hypothetical protein
MCGKNAFVVLSTIVAIIVVTCGLDSSFASGHEVKEPREGGWVTPCSLAGVNPIYHPEIFRVPDRGSGNPTPLGGWDCGASDIK